MHHCMIVLEIRFTVLLYFCCPAVKDSNNWAALTLSALSMVSESVCMVIPDADLVVYECVCEREAADLTGQG